MKSVHNLVSEPAGIPITADEVLEFHAARLILLLRLCGTSNRIKGLTKLAKLDFFVRYPQFFESLDDNSRVLSHTHHPVESSMVRFHYGPWDKRYYHILTYLEAKRLISVTQQGKGYDLELTPLGIETAKKLARTDAFQALCEHMKQVKRKLGGLAGSTLKNMIYKNFEKEVTRRPLGEAIK